CYRKRPECPRPCCGKVEVSLRIAWRKSCLAAVLVTGIRSDKKARRDHLIIMDDPAFDLNMDLPPFFRFDDDGNILSQEDQNHASFKTTSQMSPFTFGSISGLGGSFLDGSHSSGPSGGSGGLNLPRSHSSQLPSALGLAGTMEPLKSDNQLMPFGEEEDMQVFDNWGIEMDAEG